MSIQSKTIENDKKFWKTVKPLLSNKNPMSKKITLIEDGRILSNDMEVAECLMSIFAILRIVWIFTPFLKRYQNICLWNKWFRER